MSTVGVVVMAYGTPARPEDLEAYYTHIRGGRAPDAGQLDDLRRRYDAIGGSSTLAERTAAQVAAITAAFHRISPERFVVALGQKHAPPFIEDAVDTLASRGVSTVVGVVLTPHYSRSSVGEYHRRAAERVNGNADSPLAYVGVDSWYDLPSFIEHQAAALREALATVEAETSTPAAGQPGETAVVFTAHSLPERALVGDPYPAQLEEGARHIAAAAGLDPSTGWSLAWQSAGRTPDPWRGPDIAEVVDDLAASNHVDAIVVVPHGFTTDHLEVAYDLDLETARRARALGLRFARAAVVDDDPAVMGGLAARIVTSAAAAPTS